MVEVLKMLGEYLQKKTSLPYDIQPTIAHREDAHFIITLEGLDIQVLHTLAIEEENRLDLIGIEVGIMLNSSGSDLAWVESVYTASVKANLLFAEYFNVTLDKEQLMGFACGVEKKQSGRFSREKEGTPFVYEETWKATITIRGGQYGYQEAAE